MHESSEEWTEKYRPKSLQEVVGNEKAVEELNEWAEGISKARLKKAIILYGPPGCGKTSAALALAADRSWEVLELNASDQRSEKVIKSIVGQASASTTFSKATRLIILDEADNLHGKEDRGGTKAITEIVKRSTQPIILIANDKYNMGKALLRNCKLITFHRIKPGTIYRVLKRISIEEELDADDSVLLNLAKSVRGDLRSAINDLLAISLAESLGEQGYIPTGARDLEEDIFAVLRKMFGLAELKEVLNSLYSLDKTPEESIQWIHKNFSYEYDDESFLHGLHYLSRADTFLGRARSSENFKFWRYASSLMACGVLTARALLEAKGEGLRRRQYFYSPWQREPRSGDERSYVSISEDIVTKIAERCKVPLKYARFMVAHFLKILFLDKSKAVDITASLRLDVSQISSLMVDTSDKETAKRIYQDARALLAREWEEERPEREKPVVEAESKAEERPTETEEMKPAETEEMAGEREPKNQKTLTDFF